MVNWWVVGSESGDDDVRKTVNMNWDSTFQDEHEKQERPETKTAQNPLRPPCCLEREMLAR